MEGQKCIAKVSDLSGRLVVQEEFFANNFSNQINLPELNNGLYILLLKIENKNLVYKINYQH
jgi:hypothetical protein